MDVIALALLLGALGIGGTPTGAAAENSGGFRGPQRNGILPSQGLLKRWPESGPKLLWEARVGKGWSSCNGSPVPVRIGDRTAVFGNFCRGAGAVWADTGAKFWVDSTVKVKNRGLAQIVANEDYLFFHGAVVYDSRVSTGAKQRDEKTASLENMP